MSLRGITINALPEASDPTTLAEITALVIAATGLLTVIVWPFLIGFALWLYRKPLTHLVGRVRNAKGFGLDLDMAEVAAKAEVVEIEAAAAIVEADDKVVSETQIQADEASDDSTERPTIDSAERREAVAEDIEPKTESPSSLPDSSWERGVYQIKRYNQWNNTFTNLVRTHPPSALLFAWVSVEERLRKIADAHMLEERFSSSQIIRELYELDAISPALRSLLLDLAKIRQQVVHSQIEVTATDAQQFRESARTAEVELDRIIASLGRARF